MPILNANYSNLNHEEMAVSIGLKPKHMPMLIGSFLEESAGILEALTSAISSNDFKVIQSNAHSIKGSAGNLKFSEIYEMMKEMEFAATASNVDFDYAGYLAAVKEAIGTIAS
ncbi:MAG: Hpt domain-containing protein [Sulfurimonas sp.]|nr:Hpt domain-containing protein [Sulfurimonas sp.]MDQ7060069.1 Hpt domain-containing protein [Sulfurimonas sp.]